MTWLERDKHELVEFANLMMKELYRLEPKTFGPLWSELFRSRGPKNCRSLMAVMFPFYEIQTPEYIPGVEEYGTKH